MRSGADRLPAMPRGSVARDRRRRVVFSASKSGRDSTPLKTNGQQSLAQASTAKPSQDAVSIFGHGLMITGTIVCTGAMQIFGRVNGEIHAAHLVVCEGAKVEGKITAEEVVIQGAFNGTIHGNSVKLLGNASVDGEIYKESLTVEQNVQFEGVSRRLERPVEAPTGDQVNGAAPSLAPSVPAPKSPAVEVSDVVS
jgi:cytoskeletal protein CcmA (bactofilin family)